MLKLEDSNHNNYRGTYIAVFCIVLLVSVLSVAAVYYLIRYKKKYYFEAAGRKFIISINDIDELLLIFKDIIIADDKHKFEEVINCIIV
jgi:hypothetical protein